MSVNGAGTEKKSTILRVWNSSTKSSKDSKNFWNSKNELLEINILERERVKFEINKLGDLILLLED